jgi:hypothetical protein
MSIVRATTPPGVTSRRQRMPLAFTARVNVSRIRTPSALRTRDHGDPAMVRVAAPGTISTVTVQLLSTPAVHP